MEAFDALMGGFAIALQPTTLMWGFIGCFVGTLVGVLPGIGPALTIAAAGGLGVDVEHAAGRTQENLALVSADIAGRALWPRHAALVGAGLRADTSGVQGRAAERKRHRLRQAAVVGQWLQLGIGEHAAGAQRAGAVCDR
jgi:hypothetical protein